MSQLLKIKDQILKNIDISLTNIISNTENNSLVLDKLIYWALTDGGIYECSKPYNGEVLERVINLYHRKINGENIDKQEWLEAEEFAEKNYLEFPAPKDGEEYLEGSAAMKAYYAFHAADTASRDVAFGVFEYGSYTTRTDESLELDGSFFKKTLDKLFQLLVN